MIGRSSWAYRIPVPWVPGPNGPDHVSNPDSIMQQFKPVLFMMITFFFFHHCLFSWLPFFRPHPALGDRRGQHSQHSQHSQIDIIIIIQCTPSEFEMRFAIASQHLGSQHLGSQPWVPGSQPSQPKHVSNPDSVLKKFKPHLVHDYLLVSGHKLYNPEPRR